ncbi:MAG: aminotransferase class V-fold PLP-dependent enzyme [Candidatus Absconditabacteria bacterium]|nr:aminotransferase class V-fold PLP-dependent enzyme [Candidatus Absconditabacteria bacterium]MDD3868017.1 aminotransferase class V-fold PLP-dependent enzyme [Candidatus Absconditabacteria bacterium]MDD4714264.1 aminotransferase class V-fold PLP-dependent enzyme [Candidatus Absconditabacteria bacterium]
MKKYFPIFQNNPGLVFLDNAASTQKPQTVIDGVSEFLANDYANIHRGFYKLSERSELAYHASKEKLAQLIRAEAKEIIYTYNASYAFNLIAQTLVNSKKLGKGDTVLVGIWEHHSNILVWQTLSKSIGFSLKFIAVNSHFDIDREDFVTKYDESVKVVSVSQVSNVTGTIIDVARIKTLLRDDTFFIIDGSQSVPHFPVNMQTIGCDAFVMTAHKMLAHTGLGMLYLKHQWVKELTPTILGGGTVKDVSQDAFSLQGNTDKFEAGTPNIVGAVSLLKALEFIESVGGIESIWNHEKELVTYATSEFTKRKEKVQVLGSLGEDTARVGVFSFIPYENQNFNRIGETFAQNNICIRAGGHCAYPLHKSLGVGGSARMSSYLYNDIGDLENFFAILDPLI